MVNTNIESCTITYGESLRYETMRFGTQTKLSYSDNVENVRGSLGTNVFDKTFCVRFRL